MNTRRFRQFPILWAGLLVHLWAIVAPSAHLVLEPHQICPEHGELVHRHASVAPAPAGLRTPSESPVLEGGPPLAATAEPHTHCALLQDRARDTLLPATASWYLALADVVTAPVTWGGIPPQSHLAVAPKHSPPCC